MSNRRMKLEPHEELRLFNTYQRRCVGCGRRGKLEIDHVRSVADGGEDSLRNAQPLCPRCNTYKGERSLDLRGWRGAAPFRLYRRVFWKPGRRRVHWRKLVAVLVRPLAILALAVTLLFVVTPAEDAIAAALATAWQGVRWYVYAAAGGGLVWWLAGKWNDRQLVYPDQYGQLPWLKGELRQHPEHAVRSNVVHQRYQIIRAERTIGEKVSIRMDQPKEQPVLDAPLTLVLPERVSLSQVRQRIPRGELALGMLDGDKLLSAPPSLCYHMLFNGETRSGKTNAINGIITQLHEQAINGMPLRLYAGDRKGEFARAWSTSPLFPDGVATNAADIADMLTEVVNDAQTGLESRNRLFARAAQEGGKVKHVIANIDDYEKVSGQPLERVFIIVDEINALMLEASKDNRLEASLMQLLQMGAGYGFYLLAGAQHLTAATLGTEGKYNFTTRAHFGDFNQTAVNMLFGKVDADALRPYMNGTKGRGLIKTVGNASPQLFQSVHCEERDILNAITIASPHVLPAASVPLIQAPVTPAQHQEHQCIDVPEIEQKGGGVNTGVGGVAYNVETLRRMNQNGVTMNQAVVICGLTKGTHKAYQEWRAMWREATGK